jgi:hypothetical protein
MNLLELFLQDRSLSLQDFYANLQLLNENKYILSLRSPGVEFIVNQKHVIPQEYHDYVKSINRTRNIKLLFSSEDYVFPRGCAKFETEIQPFNDNQSRFHLSMSNWENVFFLLLIIAPIVHGRVESEYNPVGVEYPGSGTGVTIQE